MKRDANYQTVPLSSFVIVLGTLLLLVLYQLSVSTLPPRFIDFTPLQWRLLQGCAVGAAPETLPGRDASAGTYLLPASTLDHGIRCSTDSFTLLSPRMKIEYAGLPKPGRSALTFVAIRSMTGEVLAQEALFPEEEETAAPVVWRVLELNVDPNIADTVNWS